MFDFEVLDVLEAKESLEEAQEDSNVVMPLRGSRLESLKTVTMRRGEPLTSQRLAILPGSVTAKVLQTSGLRMLVQTDAGLRGWVSFLATRGEQGPEPLWRRLRSPPRTPQGPTPVLQAKRGCTVRSFREGDEEQLFEMERLCFQADEQMMRHWIALSEPWEAKKFNLWTFIDVLEEPDEGRVVGYAAWACDGKRPHLFLHVLSLAVHPAYRGRRFGQELLTAIKDAGSRKYPEAVCITLNVRADNPAAQRD